MKRQMMSFVALFIGVLGVVACGEGGDTTTAAGSTHIRWVGAWAQRESPESSWHSCLGAGETDPPTCAAVHELLDFEPDGLDIRRYRGGLEMVSQITITGTIEGNQLHVESVEQTASRQPPWADVEPRHCEDVPDGLSREELRAAHERLERSELRTTIPVAASDMGEERLKVRIPVADDAAVDAICDVVDAPTDIQGMAEIIS